MVSSGVSGLLFELKKKTITQLYYGTWKKKLKWEVTTRIKSSLTDWKKACRFEKKTFVLSKYFE